MSLEVPAALLARAEAGPVDDAEFVGCVRESLPYAWQVVSAVAGRLADAPPDQPYAVHATPPPSEAHRGQLLRALASDAIRGAMERYFGVRLAFQNCHRVAAFRPGEVGGTAYVEFVSPAAQLRNQSPELRDC
ncbi:MAG TPA: SCO5389 family protein [Natronosporangium sp.]